MLPAIAATIYSYLFICTYIILVFPVIVYCVVAYPKIKRLVTVLYSILQRVLSIMQDNRVVKCLNEVLRESVSL